jgi:hypothetical protein
MYVVGLKTAVQSRTFAKKLAVKPNYLILTGVDKFPTSFRRRCHRDPVRRSAFPSSTLPTGIRPTKSPTANYRERPPTTTSRGARPEGWLRPTESRHRVPSGLGCSWSALFMSAVLTKKESNTSCNHKSRRFLRRPRSSQLPKSQGFPSMNSRLCAGLFSISPTHRVRRFAHELQPG